MAEIVIYDSSDDEDNDYDEIFDIVKQQLNVKLCDKVLVIAELGLWNGKKSGYKLLDDSDGKILSDVICQVIQGDYIKIVYEDVLDDLIVYDTHHDGTNKYLYRLVKKDYDINELLRKIYAGFDHYTREDINKYTSSLGKYIRDVYGYEVATPIEAS